MPIEGDASHDVRYQRQAELGINQDQHVAIIGCGGVGSWIALYLGLAGVRAITIYDSDTLDTHNLNRFPLGPAALGKYKSVAMAEHLQELRPDIMCVPRMNFDPQVHDLTEDNGSGSADWAIVSTDSLKSRRMVYDTIQQYKKKYGRDAGPKYIEAGADGSHMTVTFEPAAFSTELEEAPGYQSVPVFVGPCTLAASIVSYYVLKGQPQQETFIADWRDSGRLDLVRVDESEPITTAEAVQAEADYDMIQTGVESDEDGD